jgi:hypothetical protein
MYGGDEALHGRIPTQGIEFCSINELMFSLETRIGITGNVSFMDHLENVTYNALPAQASDDFTSRQYFQQANQVMLTRHRRNFFYGGWPWSYRSVFRACYRISLLYLTRDSQL